MCLKCYFYLWYHVLSAFLVCGNINGFRVTRLVAYFWSYQSGLEQKINAAALATRSPKLLFCYSACLPKEQNLGSVGAWTGMAIHSQIHLSPPKNPSTATGSRERKHFDAIFNLRSSCLALMLIMKLFFVFFFAKN